MTRHRDIVRTWRFVLAKLHRDPLAEAALITDVGDCPHGWFRIADVFAGLVRDELLATCRGHIADNVVLGWVAHSYRRGARRRRRGRGMNNYARCDDCREPWHTDAPAWTHTPRG